MTATPDAVHHTLIPRRVIFGNPHALSPAISPDGVSLAWVAPRDGVLNLWVRTLGGKDDRPVTQDRERGIQVYFWARDSRTLLYLQDQDGNENWRLYSADVETGAVRDLTPFQNAQVRIVGESRRRPDTLLLAINRDDPRLHDLYRLDVPSGALTLAEKNPGDIIQWIPDLDLEVRAALAPLPDGGRVLRVRDRAADPWRTLLSWGPLDAMQSGAVAFDGDGTSLLLVDSREWNAGRLVRQPLGGEPPEVIVQDPQYDIGGVVLHPDTHAVQMAAFVRARTDWEILDPSIEEDLRAIRDLDRGDLQFLGRDDSDRVWILAFRSDREPFAFWAWEREERRGTLLFHARPDLLDFPLADMEPFSFPARDGLTVHGYVTFPRGLEPRRLPMVVNVHGGPWHRDTWGYHPEAQWLANRGYVCLQVNFRGSTGYGKEFLNAANREWGGKMHDDLVDAVEMAVARGWADPERVAIYGGSYGGYASLVGATFTPDLFRCAVAIVGPSNLLTFIRSIPPYWEPLIEIFRRRVGDPDTEEEFLRSRSPLFHADRIRIPMLIAQGANDPRVKRAESEQIVAALREHGVPHDYLLFEDEGHGFVKPQNRLKFYAAAEKFLARHLGGFCEE